MFIRPIYRLILRVVSGPEKKEGRVWEDDGKMMRRISGNNFVRFAVFTLTRVSHSDRQTNRFTVRILNDAT